jgi:hypothetical protein
MQLTGGHIEANGAQVIYHVVSLSPYFEQQLIIISKFQAYSQSILYQLRSIYLSKCVQLNGTRLDRLLLKWSKSDKILVSTKGCLE